jgi:hypothetical protein
MKRTQIQLPDPLYQEIQRVAELEEWSIAEVIRRGAEQIVRTYPPSKTKAWSLPPAIPSTLLITDHEKLRDTIRDDHQPRHR